MTTMELNLKMTLFIKPGIRYSYLVVMICFPISIHTMVWASKRLYHLNTQKIRSLRAVYEGKVVSATVTMMIGFGCPLLRSLCLESYATFKPK